MTRFHALRGNSGEDALRPFCSDILLHGRGASMQCSHAKRGNEMSNETKLTTYYGVKVTLYGFKLSQNPNNITCPLLSNGISRLYLPLSSPQVNIY